MPATDTYEQRGNSPSDEGEMLTRKEAADLVGYSVSTIRRWTRIGILPLLRTPAGRVFYRRDDVLAAAQPVPENVA